MERNYKIDNMKGSMILLVVLGHLVEVTVGWESVVGLSLMEVIFMFHMPAFIFLSGMTFNRLKWKERAIQILFIYVIFQVLYSSYFVHKGVITASDAVFKPYWLLWFLVSLSSFYAICGLFGPKISMLCVAVIISLLAGSLPFNEYVFSWLRTAVFLPFFIAGILCTKNFIVSKPVAVASVVIGLAAIIFTISFGINYKLWFGVYNFDDLAVSIFNGIGMRMFAITASFSLIFAFLSLTSNKKGLISLIGENSLSIYLLHGFFVIVVSKIYTVFGHGINEYLSVFISFILTMVVTMVVIKLPAEKIIREIMNIPLSIMKKNANSIQR